jgi:type IV secretion system pilin
MSKVTTKFYLFLNLISIFLLSPSTIFANNVVGNIGLPDHLEEYGGLTSEGGQGGLIGLLSNIIKLIMLVGGLWAFFNLIIAGFTYITSGDNPEEVKKAGQRMTMSLIGLVLVVGSFAITAIISWLLYGEPGYILNPQIYGPGVGS